MEFLPSTICIENLIEVFSEILVRLPLLEVKKYYLQTFSKQLLNDTRF